MSLPAFLKVSDTDVIDICDISSFKVEDVLGERCVRFTMKNKEKISGDWDTIVKQLNATILRKRTLKEDGIEPYSNICIQFVDFPVFPAP